MPERDIRKALKKRVEAYGGEIRAVKWIGRRNAPDVLCLFLKTKAISTVADDGLPLHKIHAGNIFVETKAPGGNPTDAQAREHERMRKAMCVVEVISTIEQLDAWLPPLHKGGW